MPGAKEIRTKIKSVRNTQKITRAMEMVAASKMRRAQDRMQSARPYSEKIRQVIHHLAHAHPEYRHPYLIERPTRRIGMIIISTDRGLCGGLNINLFRTVLTEMHQWEKQGVQVDLCVIGNKGISFFKRFGANILAHNAKLGDAPKVDDVVGTVKVMLDNYNEGKIDKLFLVANHFVNTMSQEPRVEQLIPVQSSQDQRLAHRWDYIYEPEAKGVLDVLLERYIESLTYQGVVENLACEQAARMVAMKAASDNAGSLISELMLAYNKARQAAITRELSEIVGGAAAV